MHSLSWLATNGTAAIVCFPGILYRAGAEQKIRKYLIENNYVDAIIQLPENLFFGVGIATCIMVLRKSKKENKTLFIDASKEFIKAGNKNKLQEEHINKIVSVYANRETIVHFSNETDNSEIAKEEFNLSVSTYVEPEDTREIIDIVELNVDIKNIVTRANNLRNEINSIILEIEGGSHE